MAMFKKFRPRRQRVGRKIARKVPRRRPRYYRKRQYRKKGGLASRVKCNGQVQPFAKYVQRAPYWKSKLERLYSAVSKNSYKQLAPFTISAPSGSQGVVQQFVWSGADITALLNSVAENGGASGATKNTGRIYLQQCDITINFTNSSNTPIEFDIYVFNNKRDSEDALITSWSYGIQDLVGNSLTSNNPNTYGTTPFYNPLVSTFYKCVKLMHYVVSPGQMFKYTHSNNLYRLWNNELINSDVQTDSYFKGITQTILLVSKGAPASITGALGTTSTATHEINAVMMKEYQFKYIQDNKWNLNELTNLPNSATTVYNMSGVGATDTIAAGVA